MLKYLYDIPKAQKYKYNGKEYETMHGLNTYDYGARQYDPARITWDRMDQLCEKYYHINPYVYCAGNPVNRVDPDGRYWHIIIGAVIGAGVSYFSQVAGNIANNGLSTEGFSDVDVADIAISAVEGGVFAASAGTSLLVEASVGTISGGLQGYVNCRDGEVSYGELTQVIKQAAIGALAAGAGKVAGTAKQTKYTPTEPKMSGNQIERTVRQNAHKSKQKLSGKQMNKKIKEAKAKQKEKYKRSVKIAKIKTETVPVLNSNSASMVVNTLDQILYTKTNDDSK